MPGWEVRAGSGAQPQGGNTFLLDAIATLIPRRRALTKPRPQSSTQASKMPSNSNLKTILAAAAKKARHFATDISQPLREAGGVRPGRYALGQVRGACRPIAELAFRAAWR